MAESIRQIWSKKERTVSASTTLVVDSIPLARFKKLEYVVNIEEVGGSKSIGFKFPVFNTESGVNHQVYAKAGDSIDYEIQAKVNGSECEIEVTNNESYSIAVNLVRSKQ